MVRETVAFRPATVVVEKEIPFYLTSAGAMELPDIGRIVVLRLLLIKLIFVFNKGLMRNLQEFPPVILTISVW